TFQPLSQTTKTIGVGRRRANVDRAAFPVEQAEVETFATEVQPGPHESRSFPLLRVVPEKPRGVLRGPAPVANTWFSPSGTTTELHLQDFSLRQLTDSSVRCVGGRRQAC